jgi:predicted ATPase/DNA-binding SARP family transcriptional activator
MDFSVLGPLAVTGNAGPVALGPPKQRLLLGLLLCQPGVPAAGWWLTDQLWGADPPPAARDNLRYYLHRLRRLLGADRIVRSGLGYALVAERDEVDALRFADRHAGGQHALAAGGYERAYELLDAALAEWRSGAYEELDAPRTRAEAIRLAELRLTAWEDRAEAGLALGRHAGLVAPLVEQVAEHPYRERLLASLMLALYRSGRQVEALAAYRTARQRLVEDTGLEPGVELRRLEHHILTADPSLELAAPAPPAAHLPAVPRAHPPAPIGRSAELAELRRLLSAHPVLTLTGPPGVGKSRLALALTDHDDRWLVDVAELADADQLAAAVAGVSTGRLLLDNCEQLAGACATVVGQLRERAPRLSIIMTSRVALGLPYEVAYGVSGLSVPAGGSPAEVLGSGAGALFVERAGAVDPAFALTDHNAGTVAMICRTLDGLPLAILFAAQRLQALPLAEVAAQLDDCLATFANQRDPDRRHRSLRAAIEHSYHALDPPERLVLAQLAVFPAGFSRDAAAGVVADIGAFYRLVERSLVAVDPPHYHLLHVVRRYAVELLDRSGRAGATRRRFVRHYSALAESAAQQARASPAGASAQLLAEAVQLPAAIATGLDHDPVPALRMVAALGWHWSEHPPDYLSLVDAAAAAIPAPPGLRARVLLAAALAWQHTAPARARRLLDQGIEVARAGSRPDLVPLLTERSRLLGTAGEAETGLAAAQEAHALACALGDPLGKARSVAMLGYLLGLAGNRDAGDHLLLAAEVLFDQLGDLAGRSEVDRYRGGLAPRSAATVATPARTGSP